MVTLADISRVNPFRSVQGSQPLIRHIGVVWVTLGSSDGWLMWPLMGTLIWEFMSLVRFVKCRDPQVPTGHDIHFEQAS